MSSGMQKTNPVILTLCKQTFSLKTKAPSQKYRGYRLPGPCYNPSLVMCFDHTLQDFFQYIVIHNPCICTSLQKKKIKSNAVNTTKNQKQYIKLNVHPERIHTCYSDCLSTQSLLRLKSLRTY